MPAYQATAAIASAPLRADGRSSEATSTNTRSTAAQTNRVQNEYSATPVRVLSQRRGPSRCHSPRSPP